MAKRKSTRTTKGSGSVYKRGDAYYIRYYDEVNEKYICKRLTVTGEATGLPRNCLDKDEAREASRGFLAKSQELNQLKSKEHAIVELAKQRQLIASLSFKPADIWEKYLESVTRSRSEKRLKTLKLLFDKFLAFCNENKADALDQLTPELMQKFIDQSTDGLSNRSYNEYLSSLRQIFEAVYKQVGLNENPLSQLRLKRRQTVGRKPFTLEQVDVIINAFETGVTRTLHYRVPVGKGADRHMEERVKERHYLPPHNEQLKLAFMFGVFAGCRLVDACTIKWKEVDLENKSITFEPDKTLESSGVEVSVPIIDKRFLEALIKARKNSDGSGYVMPQIAEWHKRNSSQLARTFSEVFHLACGIVDEETEKLRKRKPSIHGFHALRHSCASIFANAGVSSEVPASILGHKSVEMTEVYTHIDMKTKILAFAKAFAHKDERMEIIGLLEDATPSQIKRILEILKE